MLSVQGASGRSVCCALPAMLYAVPCLLCCAAAPASHRAPVWLLRRHIAAEQGETGVMRLLIEARAKLDLRDTAGCTPLHAAMEQQVGGLGAGSRPGA